MPIQCAAEPERFNSPWRSASSKNRPSPLSEPAATTPIHTFFQNPTESSPSLHIRDLQNTHPALQLDPVTQRPLLRSSPDPGIFPPYPLLQRRQCNRVRPVVLPLTCGISTGAHASILQPLARFLGEISGVSTNYPTESYTLQLTLQEFCKKKWVGQGVPTIPHPPSTRGGGLCAGWSGDRGMVRQLSSNPLKFDLSAVDSTHLE